MLFTAGANLAFTSSSLNVFANNNLIDLNNLANTINVNHLGLRNNMLYLGPSVSFTTFQKARFPIRLNVGYEFALTRGRWQSDFTSLDNTFGEFGKNRLIIFISILQLRLYCSASISILIILNSFYKIQNQKSVTFVYQSIDITNFFCSFSI